MSVPLALVVPAPVLAFKPIAGTFAPLESQLTLSFAAIRFPDGSAMTAADFVAAQAILSRTLTPGGTADVWDPSAKSWRAASSVALDGILGLPLIPPTTGADPWTGVFVASGQKDAAGAPLVQPATGHFPQYRLRGAFRAKRDEIEAFGLGPDSPPVEFASAVASSRFGADLVPDADSATRVRIMLRNAAAQSVGYLEIDASGGNAAVTLANFDAFGSALAAVTLLTDGSIRLQPAGGKKVIVAGDFEAEHIRYLPSSGLPKKDLS